MWPPKKGIHLFFCKCWAPFFDFKQTWATFLPRFSVILPRFLTNQNFWGVRLQPLHPRLLHHCTECYKTFCMQAPNILTNLPERGPTRKPRLCSMVIKNTIGVKFLVSLNIFLKHMVAFPRKHMYFHWAFFLLPIFTLRWVPHCKRAAKTVRLRQETLFWDKTELGNDVIYLREVLQRIVHSILRNYERVIWSDGICLCVDEIV